MLWEFQSNNTKFKSQLFKETVKVIVIIPMAIKETFSKHLVKGTLHCSTFKVLIEKMASTATVLTVVLFLSLCSNISAYRFYTQKNELCVSECANYGTSYYWCWTGKYIWSWNYCSPRENVGNSGASCRSNSPCENRGYSYKWCYLNSGSWNYCGTQRNNFEILSSTYQYYCTDSCDQRGYSYYWCHTEKGWDYCSPEEGKDFHGNRCDAGTFCDLHGSDYKCLVNGQPQYCSIKAESKEITSGRYYCSSECKYYSNGDYFWCRKFNTGWDYCSPAKDLDSHGRSCVNSCAKRISSYYWCYYDSNNNWDRCGVESPDSTNPQCPAHNPRRLTARQIPGLVPSLPSLVPPSVPKVPGRIPSFPRGPVIPIVPGAIIPSAGRKKRVPDEDLCKLVRSVVNGAHNLETRWYMRNTTTIIAPENCNQRRSALGLIAQLGRIRNGAQAGTMVQDNNVRIDLQGFFNQAGRRYANIQIQLNRPRRNRPGYVDSTTIATACVETNGQNGVNIPVRYIRDALIRSLLDCFPKQCFLETQPRS